MILAKDRWRLGKSLFYGFLIYLCAGLLVLAFIGLLCIFAQTTFGKMAAPIGIFLFSYLMILSVNVVAFTTCGIVGFLIPSILLILGFGFSNAFPFQPAGRWRAKLLRHGAHLVLFILIFSLFGHIAFWTKPRILAAELDALAKYPGSRITRTAANAFKCKEPDILWGGVSTRKIYLQVWYKVPGTVLDVEAIRDHYYRELAKENWLIADSGRQAPKPVKGCTILARKPIDENREIALKIAIGETWSRAPHATKDDFQLEMRVGNIVSIERLDRNSRGLIK